MKNILFKLSGLFFILLLWSCEKETENISRITYFPEFNFQGASVVLIAQGSAYTDPGCTAKEGGAEIPVSTEVVGESTGYSGTTIPSDVPDKYTITYTATNSDGFPGTKERVVWVGAKAGNLVSDIQGLYTSTVLRNGVSAAQYNNMKYVQIVKKSGNQYTITCGIGGYYAIGRNYGAGYLSPTTITANNIATNDFTFAPFEVGTFGGPSKITSMTIDAAAKTITVNSEWVASATTTYKFVITLKQIQN